MTRRTFLGMTAAAGTALVADVRDAQIAPAPGGAVAPPEIPTPGRPQGTTRFGASVDDVPIVDAHIHLFDGRRPEGASYMGSAAYRARSMTSLPGLYAPLARPSGIVGAIVVESSARPDDNLWYLDVARTDPIIVGVCGRIDPYSSDFGTLLDRYSKNPLDRAIRASRFYSNTNGTVTLDQVAVDNLRRLADADLAEDTANPSIPLMTANVKLADAIPSLRIIMDHLPAFDPTPENQSVYESLVKEMAARPNIFVKLSAVYHPRGGKVVDDYAILRERLDYLYGMFGADRVIFGTDYPNSYGVATISEEVGLMKQFFSTKTRLEAEKYFWRNAARVYTFVTRAKDQPSLSG